MQNTEKQPVSWIILGTAVVVIPLLLILLANWHWRPGAFVLAFVLALGGVKLFYDMVKQNRVRDKSYRSAIGIALAATFVLVWMNAAVGGILGDNPANMMYFGVILIGCVGALAARLEPQGTSFTLFGMAFAMILVPAVAWVTNVPAFANGLVAVAGLHAFFAMLFAVSAFLFRRAV